MTNKRLITFLLAGLSVIACAELAERPEGAAGGAGAGASSAGGGGGHAGTPAGKGGASGGGGAAGATSAGKGGSSGGSAGGAGGANNAAAGGSGGLGSGYGGATVDAAAVSAGQDAAVASGTFDWSNCGAESFIPNISAADFCAKYMTACMFDPGGGAGGKARFKSAADCMTKYMGLSDGARGGRACVAWHLCVAAQGNVETFCPHAPEAAAMSGPCKASYL